MSDLEQIIEDSVNDSIAPVETTDDTSVETQTDDTTESTLSADDAAAEAHPDGTDAPAVEDANQQVQSPAAKQPGTTAEDDFAKKFGLQSQSVTGRENRIPYSRVKKIVEKNEKDVTARVTKELETKYTPQLQERDTKITDYEGRLEKVAQFENILENDPRTFLGMLSKHPSYTEFFTYIEQLAGQQPAQQQQQAVVDPTADMPKPDQADGLYSMEGLQKLLAWNAEQARKATLQEVEQRYKPIEQAWQSQEQLAKIVPVVEKQIAEARTWDKFEELEDKVVAILKADKNISLERAYMKAYQEHMQTEVFPKLTTDRNTIRQEVLAELKKKPVSSATPTSQTKPSFKAEPQGNRNLEDVIQQALADANLK